MTVGISAAQLRLSKLSDVSPEYCSWRTGFAAPVVMQWHLSAGKDVVELHAVCSIVTSE